MAFIRTRRGAKFVKSTGGRHGRRTVRKRQYRKNPLARMVQKIISANEETKYVAFDSADHYIYGNLDINSDATTKGGNVADKRLFLALPGVAQSAGQSTANTRIGNSIKPVKCQVTVQYFFQQNPTASPATTNGVIRPELVEVRQLALKPKSIKRWTEYYSTVTAVSNGYKYLLPKLLEVGDNTTTAADSANPLNMLYPVSNEMWTTIAGNKKFIMGKNAGILNTTSDTNVAPLATARAQNTIRFKVKLPKKLVYDNNNSVYPENACPLFGAYAGFINNVGATTYDQTQQPYISTSSSATNPILGLNYRVELWYKDA